MNKSKFAEVQVSKSWPSPQDYNEAMQSPAINLAAPELKVGKPGLNNLGLPKAITGSFASVYYLDCPKQDFAVRCFLHNIANQQARYAKISDYLNHLNLPIMADFDYLEKGILCHGKWLPILKMDWVDGQNLIEYIGRNLDNAKILEELRLWLRQARDMLKEHGIAHGDLQHGNVLVGNDSIKLVDYDGMFVPALAGEMSNELGHRNYQHPDRTKDNFGPYLDNFSTWLIDSCLYILQRDPRLWLTLRGGEDCLLLREKDLQDPYSSFAFHELERHANSEIRERSKLLRWLLTLPVEQIPEVDSEAQIPQDFPALDVSKKKPDWLSSAETLMAREKSAEHIQYLPTDPHVDSHQQGKSAGASSQGNVHVPRPKLSKTVYDPQSRKWITLGSQSNLPSQLGTSQSFSVRHPILSSMTCILMLLVWLSFKMSLHPSRTTHYENQTESQTAIRVPASSAAEYYRAGVNYLSSNESQFAINSFNQAILIDPTEADFFVKRAEAYFNLGNYDKAIADLEEAIRIQPTSASTYFNLGELYSSMGQIKKAADMYRKVLEIDPSDSEAQHNLKAPRTHSPTNWR